jgi:hypothetical protein
MTGAKLCTRGDDRPEHITMIPLVTAFIAAVVAFIAFLQWQTAREKVLLDLFDKRFAVYEELRSVMGRHLGSGIDEPAFYNFVRTVSREVLIRTRSPDLSRRETERPRSRLPAKRPATAGSRRPSAAVQAERLARADRLSDFSKDFDELVAPYMNHHQKVLRQSLVEVAHSAIVRR